METRFQFARKMAQKYLRRHRVTGPPVPVEFMLFTEGVRVELLEYPDDTAGECWWEGDQPWIAVSRSLGAGRRRFTLAHEWGHLALRHHQRRTGDLTYAEIHLRDGVGERSSADDPVEAEANQFASELLMPEGPFRKDWDRTPHPARLAARYEVSIDAVRWRALTLGLRTRRRS